MLDRRTKLLALTSRPTAAPAPTQHVIAPNPQRASKLPVNTSLSNTSPSVCHASSRTAQRHNPVAVVRPTYSGMNLEALLENIFAQGYRLLPDTLGLPMLRQGSEDMYNPLGADRSYVTLIRIGCLFEVRHADRMVRAAQVSYPPEYGLCNNSARRKMPVFVSCTERMGLNLFDRAQHLNLHLVLCPAAHTVVSQGLLMLLDPGHGRLMTRSNVLADNSSGATSSLCLRSSLC
ncbi:hypothetical protein C8Q72DRAFT_795607 [Fomitopsis betulina]|nr:hypothetical protein C8Q72DRAFT_795607 [Fomitopsis betulina]